jgi:hypothetical protein
MHELGHNLGLRHGGIDDINYKPNYFSIMNYLFIFSKPLRNRPLTFSSAKLPRLYEADLNEIVGVTGANWDWTVYSGLLQNRSGEYYIPLAVPTNANIDWDNDGDENEISVQANINSYPQWDYQSGESQPLEGYDDWANLLFYFQENKNFAEGEHDAAFGSEEITWEIVQAMEQDTKNMVGGPTGPVQILDVDVPDQPSPQEGDTFLSIDNSILVIVAVVVIIAVVAAGLLVLRKKRKSSE